jgi:hypothetical protein
MRKAINTLALLAALSAGVATTVRAEGKSCSGDKCAACCKNCAQCCGNHADGNACCKKK